MFLKDAHSSLDMVYDEEHRARDEHHPQQLMSVPVSDFKLSVRVRNCLHRMNIHTWATSSHTEEELLASKNSARPRSPRSRRCSHSATCVSASTAKSLPRHPLRARKPPRRSRHRRRGGPHHAHRPTRPVAPQPQVHGAPGHRHPRPTRRPHARGVAREPQLRPHVADGSRREARPPRPPTQGKPPPARRRGIGRRRRRRGHHERQSPIDPSSSTSAVLPVSPHSWTGSASVGRPSPPAPQP